MTRAYTDYPRQGRYPHMAPIMGAVPIFGPRYGEGVKFRGPEGSSSVEAGAVVPASVTEPTSPSAELALAAGTAAFAGAAVGGVAGGSWRGAGIGAGMNVGLWSAITAAGHWEELTPGSKGMLLGGAGVGLLLATVLVVTRAK